jgi:hypothetical protein
MGHFQADFFIDLIEVGDQRDNCAWIVGAD